MSQAESVMLKNNMILKETCKVVSNFLIVRGILF